jgi:hypothetical protein
MTSPTRGLYFTFAALCAATLLLGAALARPRVELRPVARAMPFDLDEPPAGASDRVVTP